MKKIHSTVIYGNNVTDLAEWQKAADPWTVILRYDGRQMTVNFWTGYAAGEPDTESVLECLVMDAIGIENARSFDDWATEYGYDADSRLAEKIYNAVEKQTAKLRNFLGNDYDSIIYADDEDLPKFAA